MTATPQIDRLLAEHGRPAILGVNVVRLPVAGTDMDGPLIAPNPAGVDLLKELTVELRGVRDNVGTIKEQMARLDGQDLSVRLAKLDGDVARVQLDLVGLGGRVLALEDARKANAWRAGELFKAMLPWGLTLLSAAIAWVIATRH